MKPLSPQALEHLARQRDNPLPLAVVMSVDETTATTEPWTGELPDAPGGYALQATAVLLDPSRLDRVSAASSSGPDLLYIDVSQEPGDGIVDSVEVRGRIALVEFHGRPTLVHLSDAGAVLVFAVDIHPASDDRERHPRTPDGRRIAAFACTPHGRGRALPRLLLDLLAAREPRRDSVEVLVLPSVSTNMLPGIPTVGEARRRAKRGKDAPLDLERVMATVRSQRKAVAVSVKLDDLSMRLAAESFHKQPKRRKTAIDALLPYPAHADSEDELQVAVQKALAHFDTDYLLSFDAVQAVLAEASIDGPGTALDESLEGAVADMRFGPSTGRSSAQRSRVARHFETMRQVSVVVAAKDGRSFRGPIIVRTGELLDTTRTTPLKVGDRVMLNPDLYRDMRAGRGLFVDSRYFRLDPYRQDAHLRLYRYLAGRWSMSSVKHAARGDWSTMLKLADALDMAGVDWRTDVRQRGRSTGEALRTVREVLSELQDMGLIGEWTIEGDDLTSKAVLRVQATAALREALVSRRAKLHAAAAAGTLQAPKKRAPRKP
jgi:hypothetical protein